MKTCSDYEQRRVDRAVREAVELIGGMEQIVRPGDKVLLKVNLLAPAGPQEAITTHPAVVKAVAGLVLEAGGSPVVADSPGYTYAGGRGRTIQGKCKALRECGLWQVGDDLGIEATQFEAQEAPFTQVDVPGGILLQSVYAARMALEADVIITLPKLKTHASTWYTGAVKNMFGAVATKTRKEAHRLATYERFSTALVDVYAVFQPRVRMAVMDAIVGMEGEGPRHGSPKQANLIIASLDPVALDSVGARVIGFDPSEILIIRYAAERGFGSARLSDIEILGALLEDVAVDFEKPSGRRVNLPPIAMKIANRLIKVRPGVNRGLCDRCSICARSCPVNAIAMGPYPEIDRDDCIECYCCNEMCPTGSMEIRKNWLARRMG